MPNWHHHILKEFTPGIAQLTLVADPDNLLVEEELSQQIRERGFDVMYYDDPISFRFAYESKFRARWNRGESGDLVVICNRDQQGCHTLPYDLLQSGRQLSFNLADLFPGMSYSVLAALDRSHLGILFQARNQNSRETMGDNATKDFILKHVFAISPQRLHQSSDILRMLLRRHYQNQRIPEILNDRLVAQLQSLGWFDEWSLEEIISDRKAFFGFLQERWPIFLQRFLQRLDGTVWLSPDESVPSYGMRYSGPAVLPFDHDDIRIYCDNLFLEGILKPVTMKKNQLVKLSWVQVGILQNPQADRQRRWDTLWEKCDTTLPQIKARHHEWIQYARLWGQLMQMVHDPEHPLSQESQAAFLPLQTRVDATFQTWMNARFGGLHNQPSVPPVMVHHIPRAMARQLAGDRHRKILLLVVDGLALDQWYSLRQILTEQQPNFHFHEHGLFAWVPTLTSFSRQAIFSGKAPLYFPTSLTTSKQEPQLWRQFWQSHNLTADEIAYLHESGNGSLQPIEKILANHRIRVCGLVISKVDKMMHGMTLGAAGMQASVKQWAKKGYLSKLLERCFAHGFEVFLTSDHGNIEAQGVGRPAEGVMADLRGERCRVYPKKALRTKMHKSFATSLMWPDHGLPDGVHALLASQRSAFVEQNSVTVAHGGISLEEVIVPFIQVEMTAS